MRFRNPPKYCHFCREFIPKSATRCVWCFRPLEAVDGSSKHHVKKFEKQLEQQT